MLKHYLSDAAETIREINRKYETPSIEMSGAVRIALFALRIYLVVLVCLFVYKFITIL
ncbi:hypothetical protein [Syntrophobacter fumaroxidans]|uniref:hypothetical protein n=1 Tax=Syntrophobacter fumaroxidans TaxID=119484 RepID=UPI0000573E13|nr:hypothetical protein [Syntrophobacter fumaroxidans]